MNMKYYKKKKKLIQTFFKKINLFALIIHLKNICHIVAFNIFFLKILSCNLKLEI